MVVEVVMIPWSFKILFLLLLQKFEIAYDKKILSQLTQTVNQTKPFHDEFGLHSEANPSSL